MLIIQLLRFLRGYLCFQASEGFPERFLNLCNQAGVAVWDIAWQGGVMSGKTDRRGFARMQTCAPPAGIVLQTQRKVGLPFFLMEYRRRVGLLLGLGICVACLAALSGRVWTIQVQGNAKVETAQILQEMETLGVRQGARRRRLMAKDISAAALRKLPGLSWISLNLRGSSAVIEVREELPQAPAKPSAPQSIVARKTGQLRVFEVYGGKPHVSLGDAVLEGGVLVSGAMENADASMRYVRAAAYAVARTNIAARAEARRSETPGKLTIPKTHYTLCFLNLRIPLGPRPTETAAVWRTRFVFAPRVGGQTKPMPLALERVSYVVWQPQVRVKSDAQLRLSAAEALFAKGFATLRTAQFLRQAVHVELGKETCKAALAGSAFENIGMEQPI
jgi:similar to stage IV sporulation protein